ncbi:MAG: enhanced serine sensitivity protein SseB C-terminal domain-containing protein [Clostridiales bacterium]|nr:enhanced serine sensitivity protein SseB C-terminal domain-containing protein [Clostridiales bacterium]
MSDDSNKIERIENEKLVELMGKIRQDPSEENMIAVLKEAAVAKFLVPVDGTEGNYSFHAMSDSKGLKYMVVYSDSDSFEVAFEDKKEPQNGVIAGFADLIDVVMAPKMDLSGFVINPGSEQVLFGKDMLKMIAAQMGIGGDGTAKVGEPDKYPPELKKALEGYLQIEPTVSSLWVRLMRENGTDRLIWLIVAEAEGDGEPLKYTLENLRKYSLPYLDNMDAMVVSSKEDFAQKVIAGVKPFVTRIDG